jgi:23S rRNA pseudouridine1911/1915/1917 synthase
VAVHPLGPHLADTLIQRVHARYGQGFELERGGAPRCATASTARPAASCCRQAPIAHADVMAQFERREVEKEYLAIVLGVPERDGGVIDMPIGAGAREPIELKMTIAPTASPRARLARARAPRGLRARRPARPHRPPAPDPLHMDAIGHPLVGDKLYGAGRGLFERASTARSRAPTCAARLPRHALHNHRVGFRSPALGRRVEVVSEPAEDMRRSRRSRA